MLRILKAEIGYNKKLILGSFAFVLVLCLFEILIAGARTGYVLIASYLLTVLWNVFRNKERREYQLMHLPLSAREIAAARILMIVLACVSLGLFYFLTYSVFHLKTPDAPIKLVAYLGIMLTGFSLYFFVRDFWSASWGNMKFTAKDFKAIMILVFIGINFLLIIAIIQTRSTGRIHPFIRFLDKMNMLADPTGRIYQILIFAALSLVLASFTVLTYSRRNSYLR